MGDSSLSQEAIYDVVEKICEKANKCDSGWKFSRAKSQDLQESFQGQGTIDEALIYGVVAEDKDGARNLTTFYFAYSTWEGRVIELDRLGADMPPNRSKMGGLALAFYRVLAQIAVELSCSRLNWANEFSSPGHPTFPAVEVEHLNGWLTVQWQRPSFQKYAADNGITLDNINVDRTRPLKDTFKLCLQNQSNEHFEMTLASTPAHAADIRRLVQGLATYEKEPDAVATTTETFQRDGLSDGKVFYQCILLKERCSDHMCGMALCFATYSLDSGVSLYLEDLFLEESTRGKGAGKLIMVTLAAIGYAMGAPKINWVVLVRWMAKSVLVTLLIESHWTRLPDQDWNTPSINFYKKIGAEILEGVELYRFSGDALATFASS